MSKTWSFYDPETGAFSGRTFSGAERLLAANTPSGLAAKAGKFDALSQRIDVKTGEIIGFQPQDPGDGRHEYDERAKRWVVRQDVRDAEAAAAEALANIEAIERNAGQRALREALLALNAPESSPERKQAFDRLSELDSNIAALRPALQSAAPKDR